MPPYHANGRTTYNNTQNKSGVYIIKEFGRLVYIGSSTKNLYKTLYRHFEKWNHRGQEVITYVNRLRANNYTVRVILCTAAQAVKLERALILKHRPRDNENKYLNYEIKFPDVQLIAQYESYKGEKLSELKELTF